ncbi:hypothetical protein [Roseateles sp. BYS87W]|uniref:Uncharacterized protein n=1 Tax=Pelomonas baiyunensis TaxID=3299026 RepID=A0ABW7H1W0_9BURK
MTPTTRRQAWRLLAAVLLAVATLGFGAAGLCGAAFTVMSLPDAFSHRPENYAGAALVIAVPSLLIGGGLAWICGRAFWRSAHRRPEDDKV